MAKCDDPGCVTDHAFSRCDDCLSAALWEGGADYWDESTGDQDGFGAYAALCIAEEEFTVPEWAWTGDGDMVVPAGTNVLLVGARSGRVYSTYFDSPASAQDAYDGYDRDYGIWSEFNDR